MQLEGAHRVYDKVALERDEMIIVICQAELQQRHVAFQHRDAAAVDRLRLSAQCSYDRPPRPYHLLVEQPVVVQSASESLLGRLTRRLAHETYDLTPAALHQLAQYVYAEKAGSAGEEDGALHEAIFQHFHLYE